MLLDGPAIVRVNLFVRSIATISDIKMVSYSRPASLVRANILVSSLLFFLIGEEVLMTRKRKVVPSPDLAVFNSHILCFS
jgi:hypothetical protein